MLHGYGHVVLATSAVRGPFIPPSLRETVTWHVALTSSLLPRGAASLAGAVVSCATQRWGGPVGGAEGRAFPGQGSEEQPLPPFPEFTAIAATRAAIELSELGDDLPPCPAPAAGADGMATAADTHAGTAGADAAAGGGTVAAASSLSAIAVPPTASPAASADVVLAGDGITAAEAAAMRALRAWSGAALSRGLRLASLAVRQRGVDWGDKRTWGCNGGVSPLPQHANDGHSLAPYEALFVPLSSADDVDMPYGTPAEWARTYSEDWGHQARTGAGGKEGALPPSALARNRYFDLGPVFKLPAVLLAVALGEECFDVEHFLQANPDMAQFGLPASDVWKWFVFAGQFQPRPYRLRCGMDWSKYGLRAAAGGRSGGGGRGGGASSAQSQQGGGGQGGGGGAAVGSAAGGGRQAGVGADAGAEGGGGGEEGL